MQEAFRVSANSSHMETLAGGWPALQGTMKRHWAKYKGKKSDENVPPTTCEQRMSKGEWQGKGHLWCMEHSTSECFVNPYKSHIALCNALHCIEEEIESPWAPVFKHILKFPLIVTLSCVTLRKYLTSLTFYSQEVFIHRLWESQLHFWRRLLLLDTRYRWWFTLGESSGPYLSLYDWSRFWSYIWQHIR